MTAMLSRLQLGSRLFYKYLILLSKSILLDESSSFTLLESIDIFYDCFLLFLVRCYITSCYIFFY